MSSEEVKVQLRLVPAGHQPCPIALRFEDAHGTSSLRRILFTGGPDGPARRCCGFFSSSAALRAESWPRARAHETHKVSSIAVLAMVAATLTRQS